MMRMKMEIGAFYFLAVLIATAASAGAARTKVAVWVQNCAGDEYADLVGAVSRELRTQLEVIPDLAMVDEKQIASTARRLGLEGGGAITERDGAELGRELGAEVVATGCFSLEEYRLEAIASDARQDEILGKQEVTGQERDVFDMVDRLGMRLRRDLSIEEQGAKTVAILPFANRARDEYDGFVQSVADMLRNSLRQDGLLQEVGKTQVEQGMAHLQLNPGQGSTQQEAWELGHWLDADVVVVGHFVETHRFGMRTIDARKGKLLRERSVEDRGDDAPTMGARLASLLARDLEAIDRETWKVAVLFFENHASEAFGNFVGSIPDMLMTSLGKADRLKLIERVQIDKAIENFDLELSGAIDAQTAVEVGTWLGADAVILGSFTRFGEVFRIDGRLIDAGTGELMLAQDVRGAEEEVMSMVDRLGNGLVERFANRESEEKGGVGTLHVRFKTVKTEMGERPVYFHLCKLYVDGRYIGMSPVVERVGEELGLFTRKLRTGHHQVRIVHGFAKEGEWDGEMPQQPEAFHVEIESGGTVTVRYAFEVGWFEDRYVYGRPW